ncbi:hypothetical protein PPIS_a1015 [Pseudoalteromonas piscicida]|uniref:Uncharacterized protein n=1 Tax=Pseudoalteromonas piscicida TaxID=43662 RepID=A0ABN5CH30_PSEO7|nr:hypothetical protein PPIS_a1015 [Pseudoalteromonas piscicida]
MIEGHESRVIAKTLWLSEAIFSISKADEIRLFAVFTSLFEYQLLSDYPR